MTFIPLSHLIYGTMYRLAAPASAAAATVTAVTTVQRSKPPNVNIRLYFALCFYVFILCVLSYQSTLTTHTQTDTCTTRMYLCIGNATIETSVKIRMTTAINVVPIYCLPISAKNLSITSFHIHIYVYNTLCVTKQNINHTIRQTDRQSIHSIR